MPKRQRTITVLLIIALIFFIPVRPAMAEVDPRSIMDSLSINLPNVRIMPDSPLYNLKRQWEMIRILLAGTPEEKANLLIQLAEVRLAEAVEMVKENNADRADQLVAEYQSFLVRAAALQDSVNSQGGQTQIKTKLQVQEKKSQLFDTLAGEYRIEWTR